MKIVKLDLDVVKEAHFLGVTLTSQERGDHSLDGRVGEQDYTRNN